MKNMTKKISIVLIVLFMITFARMLIYMFSWNVSIINKAKEVSNVSEETLLSEKELQKQEDEKDFLHLEILVSLVLVIIMLGIMVNFISMLKKSHILNNTYDEKDNEKNDENYNDIISYYDNEDDENKIP